MTEYVYFVSYATGDGFGWRVLARDAEIISDTDVVELNYVLEQNVGKEVSIISFQLMNTTSQ